MSFIKRDIRFSKDWFLSYAGIVLGSLAMAMGYVYFIVPYKIINGGVFGISIVLHHHWGLPVGMTALVLNIPLVLWGIRELGPRFGLKTVIGMVLVSVMVDLLTWFSGDLALSQDPLISAVYGGVLIGLGLGLIFRSRATSGGSDIVAQIATKYTRIPVGQTLMAVDTIIVLVGVATFRDVTLALYAVTAIFVSGKVIDAVVAGLQYLKTVIIISEHSEELKEVILHKMGRGGTVLLGRGMYTGDSKDVLYCSVNRRELANLVAYVREIDPSAFMTIINTQDVLGEGFKSFEKAADEP
jgi:uncharacterized membrane-anchored protein YitT (DUF2179 family)